MHTHLISALAASALLASPLASAAARGPEHDAREVLESTALDPGQSSALSAIPLTSRVRVSVFVGRDQAGLAGAAQAISDPASPRYAHYLSPALVRADYGATAAQERSVSSWLAGSGLVVTHREPFVISASGTAAQAESAVRATLELSRPAGGVEQVVPDRAMVVPRSVAGAISTIRVAAATAPVGRHEPLRATAGAGPAARIKGQCSDSYGQKKAAGLPDAYGRTLTWAPCGYLPSQLRRAYGATRSGLTGAGVGVAILSEDNDWTALSDANRWARNRRFPPFAPGQFAANIARHVPSGLGDAENALDIESVHGMAPAAKVTILAGNGRITGDRLLDALDKVVTYRIADVVTSSWFEGYMPAPRGMIRSWDGVLERAAVEGITVNFATGDFGDETPLQYPGSDPWITTVGGTSLAIGHRGGSLWETGWESDEARLSRDHKRWIPSPPGRFAEGSTGGISRRFAEPYYQRGVVTGNIRHGKAMRAVPDVSALGDWNLGYQIGLSERTRHHRHRYVNAVNGGTSLSSPLLTGFEADLIQGRRGIALGFANPLLYDYAGTDAFHDITSNPRRRGFTEAVVFGPAYRVAPTLSTMGQCASTRTLTCGPGYDTVSGLGSPGPAFFRSFGSRPK